MLAPDSRGDGHQARPSKSALPVDAGAFRREPAIGLTPTASWPATIAPSMVNPEFSVDAAAWHGLTRLGEAQILLPAMLLAVGWLAWRGAHRLALAWLMATGLAAVVTTASKVAFLGYGVGLAALDFTGLSGHAMFAAAVLPPLLRLAAGAHAPAGPGGQRISEQISHQIGLLAGYALAGAVALSRVMVGAHSWSESLAGFALGAAASALALRWAGALPPLRSARWVPAALLGWALLGVVGAPPPRTHDWVTRLALAQSGRAEPFRRWQLRHPQHEHPALRQQREPQVHGGAGRPPANPGRPAPSLQGR